MTVQNPARPVTAPGRKTVAAATTTVVLWSSAFIAIRDAGEHFSAGALALGRLLTGTLAMAVILLINRARVRRQVAATGEAVRLPGIPPRAAWPGIVGAGVLWLGIYMIALNWGEQLVDAGTAAMVVNIGPILIALLGGWLLGEGFPGRLLAGMAVSFAGAVVVGVSVSGSGQSSVLGVLLCVLAAATYAAGVISQKPALRHGSAVEVTTFACLIGTVVCLPFAGQLVSGIAAAPVSATLWVLYLGLFPTALAFTTWAYALSHTTAGKMGATTYAVPALVVVMSWLMLDEVPTWLTLLGGALCLLGVAVSRARRKAAAVG